MQRRTTIELNCNKEESLQLQLLEKWVKTKQYNLYIDYIYMIYIYISNFYLSETKTISMRNIYK